MTMQLLEAKTETFGPLGRRKVVHGSGLRPAAGQTACMARSSFYAMGQLAEQPLR